MLTGEPADVRKKDKKKILRVTAAEKNLPPRRSQDHFFWKIRKLSQGKPAVDRIVEYIVDRVFFRLYI